MTAADSDEDFLLREFLIWIGETDRHDAVSLLEKLPSPKLDLLAAAVARRLHRQPPRAIKQELSPVQALSLAVTLLKGDALDLSLDHADEQAVDAAVEHVSASRVRGLFATRQEAAFAAVRQLGGAHRFGIPHYREAELGDIKRSASSEALEEVEDLADTNHGWYLPYADGLGYVLFRTNDR